MKIYQNNKLRCMQLSINSLSEDVLKNMINFLRLIKQTNTILLLLVLKKLKS